MNKVIIKVGVDTNTNLDPTDLNMFILYWMGPNQGWTHFDG